MTRISVDLITGEYCCRVAGKFYKFKSLALDDRQACRYVSLRNGHSPTSQIEELIRRSNGK